MCGSQAGGFSIDGVDIAKEAIIQGQVIDADKPLGKAYVRLLDATGEFTAEVPTSATGNFRFFATDGRWIIRVLAPGYAAADREISAALGSITEVVITLT